MSSTTTVLDHGSVTLVESWGSDERIVEAARMSTGKGFQGWGPLHAEWCVSQKWTRIDGVGTHWYLDPSGENHYATQEPPCDCEKRLGDEKLLRFLWEHRHTTPFEMAGMTIEVMAPIFVFREWHRHRTQSYNEMSARYTPLPAVDYMPTIERCLQTSTTNKQAGIAAGSSTPSRGQIQQWLIDLGNLYAQAEHVYQMGLKMGIPKEIARLPVPVARYSRMRASANLLNWLRFLALRMPENAQWEIRQYADAVSGLVGSCFPRTHALFAEGLK